jgi:MoxR-like ATPase
MIAPDIAVKNTNALKYQKPLTQLRQEISTIIVGQEQVIDHLLIALLAGGHVLLEGVPGIAKTLLIKTLSECLDCGFVRLQFTPDLLPADIIGTKIYNQNEAQFSTTKGPIFHQFVLADEINRAPPKVQSALLEAMQERQVTIQGETFPLEEPFFVLATQNPIESEGTYSLPEAQLDRFMLKVIMTYPSLEEEVRILDRFSETVPVRPSSILTEEALRSMQAFTRTIYTSPEIKRYVAELVDATRTPEAYGLSIGGYIACGASPRASISLVLAAKAHALLNGRGYVIPHDIKAVAHSILRHRIIRTYTAEAEEVSTDQMIDSILGTVRVP